MVAAPRNEAGRRIVLVDDDDAVRETLEEYLRGHGFEVTALDGGAALRALVQSRADLAVSVTGIAGPGGATETKPVGLVFFGLCRRGGAAVSHRFVFPGHRQAVRGASLTAALELLAAEVAKA